MNVKQHEVRQLGGQSTVDSIRVSANEAESILGYSLPSILGSKRGLAEVPRPALQRKLQPVMQALRDLDAEHLLGLQTASSGPRLRDG